MATPICAVDFWQFATPVIVGNLAAIVAGKLARGFYNSEPDGTQAAAEHIIKFGTFWVAAGFTWIELSRQNGG